MSAGRTLAIGAAIAAAIAAAYWWPRESDPPAATVAPVATAAAKPNPEPAAAPGGAPAAGTPVLKPLRPALVHAFHGARPSRDVLDRLAAGDVAGVAREFSASPEPAGTIHLLDLSTLCASEQRAADEERNAPAAATLSPASRAVLEPWISARRSWQQRFAAGCAAATFDTGEIRRRLAATGARGDAASLERLSTLDGQPVVRLESAALLGNPQAQFRLALGTLAAQPESGRSWLELAAKGDAEAEAYLGACLLGGCGRAPDPVAARAALEHAARGGSLYALGLLSASGGSDAPRRWSRADASVTPVAPRDPDALGLEAPATFAWTALAATLAADGCFGFEFGIAAEALDGRDRLDASLRPVDIAAGRVAADELATSSGGALRQALGCD